MTDHLRKQYLNLIDDTLEFLRGKNSPILTLSPPLTPIKKVVTPKPATPDTNETKKIESVADTPSPVKKEVVPPKPQPTPTSVPKPKPIALTTPTQKSAPIAHNSFISFMKHDCPSVRLHENPQADNRAKAIRFAWKDKQNLSSVPLLYDESLLPFKTLLENIAKAISLIFTPARLLDVSAMHSNNSWETLLKAPDIKLVIAPDLLLGKYQTLSSLTQDNGTNSTLSSHPLLHLPDLSLYQKDPLLKRSLWDTLCQKLHKS